VDGGLSRRALFGGGAGLGLAALAPAAATARPRPWPAAKAPSMAGVPFEPRDTVRVGVIGLGARGMGVLPLFLDVPHVTVPAVCDLDPQRAADAARLVEQAGQPSPARYTAGDWDFQRLCARDDLDLVYVATPWEWHHPMALSALRHGKHVGVECPLATTMDDLWDLVDASEVARRHCMQLENVCYGPLELRLLRMVHEGVFGELVHGAGAYQHDLRASLFSPTRYYHQWRRAWHTRLRGNLYPTHGLGPIAAYMDVNRGDRLARLVSMETPSLGLEAYRREHVPPGDPLWTEKYLDGDMNMSVIQTAKGRLIRLEHNVCDPRPYSRVNMIAGTKGIFEGFPSRVYLEPDATDHVWRGIDQYTRYDHWLTKDVNTPRHPDDDGANYVMVWRLVQTMRLGLPPDITVYDSATWSAPGPLSRESLARGGAPVEFPDFTRGHWRDPVPGLDSVKPA
jgi:predicted dehydrogenase